MKCPVCSDATLVMTDRQGVEIDYCPDCRGVWLDRGELDKIIERTSSEPTRAPQSVHTEHRHHDYRDSRHGHHRKKKHSLLGDLFDF